MVVCVSYHQAYRVDSKRLCAALMAERDRQRETLKARVAKVRAVKEAHAATLERKLTMRRDERRKYVQNLRREASLALLSARSKLQLLPPPSS